MSTSDGPATHPLLAVAAMVFLAGLDLAGAVLAKQWSDHRSVVSLAGGIAVFGVLFVAYGSSLAAEGLTAATVHRAAPVTRSGDGCGR